MIRALFTAILFAGLAPWATAAFTLTGNPLNDPGWFLRGYSLANGNYVRGTGNQSFEIYNFQGRIQAGDNPVAGWNVGDQILGLGGRYYPTYPAAMVGWPGGYTGPIQNAGLTTTRTVAKFGVDAPGAFPNNNFNPSSTAPNIATPPPPANGFSSGFGGLGSVQISIASGRFTSGNAGLLITPSNIGGDNVAEYDGLFGPAPGHGANGLDLITGSNFNVARYIYTVDGTGNLSTWELLLNATMVKAYPGSLSANVPTGGSNWVMTIQNGSGGGFTDALVKTDLFMDAPAPPAVLLGMAGGLSLMALRRRMK